MHVQTMHMAAVARAQPTVRVAREEAGRPYRGSWARISLLQAAVVEAHDIIMQPMVVPVVQHQAPEDVPVGREQSLPVVAQAQVAPQVQPAANIRVAMQEEVLAAVVGRHTAVAVAAADTMAAAAAASRAVAVLIAAAAARTTPVV